MILLIIISYNNAIEYLFDPPKYPRHSTRPVTIPCNHQSCTMRVTSLTLDVCKSLDQRLFTVYVLIIKLQLDVPVLAVPIIHSPCMVIY